MYLASKYLVLGTWRVLVRYTRQVPSTRYLSVRLLGTWRVYLTNKYLVLGSWRVYLTNKYLVVGIWRVYLASIALP